MTKNRDNQIETSFLVKAILGVSPIPIVGEIALSSFFHDLLKEGTNDKTIAYAGVPAAIVTRVQLYSSIYLPLYTYLEKFF